MSIEEDWGTTVPGGSPTTATIDADCMGGMSPDKDDMILKSISIYCSGSGTIRLAVYQGGSLVTGPAGATLIWDAGTVSGTGWITISGGSAPLAKNAVTWLAYKTNDASFVIYFETSWPSGSDFQSAEGRWASTGESGDETDPWDNPFATGGGFADFWYSAYLTYEIPTYSVNGITKDNDGNVEGSSDVHLWKDPGDDTLEWMAYLLSNVSTGAYSFTGKQFNTGEKAVVMSFKDGPPRIFGVTDILTPETE